MIPAEFDYVAVDSVDEAVRALGAQYHSDGMAEAAGHPHNRHRGTFVEVAGVVQPGPAPRFSRTPGAVSRPPVHPGQDTEAVLTELGFGPDEVAELRASGAVR